MLKYFLIILLSFSLISCGTPIGKHYIKKLDENWYVGFLEGKIKVRENIKIKIATNHELKIKPDINSKSGEIKYVIKW